MKNIDINIIGYKNIKFENGITPLEILKSHSKFGKNSIICKINGIISDLSTNLSNDCDLQFLDAKSKEGHAILLHSTAHLMAQAVK